MGQWEIIKGIHDGDSPTSTKQIIRETGLSPGAVDAGLRKVRNKGHIRESESTGEYLSEISDERLEEIRPRTISELKNDDN